MKEIHIVYVTSLGDDWQSTEKHIVHTKEEVAHFQSKEFENEKLSIGGVEDIVVEVEENVSPEHLQRTLTVKEYCELFPMLKKLIANHWNYIHE